MHNTNQQALIGANSNCWLPLNKMWNSTFVNFQLCHFLLRNETHSFSHPYPIFLPWMFVILPSEEQSSHSKHELSKLFLVNWRLYLISIGSWVFLARNTNILNDVSFETLDIRNLCFRLSTWPAILSLFSLLARPRQKPLCCHWIRVTKPWTSQVEQRNADAHNYVPNRMTNLQFNQNYATYILLLWTSRLSISSILSASIRWTR